MPEHISPSKRKNIILDLLKNDDEVRVSELAGILGISGVTIRSDLAEMEKEGLLRRTHGGAVNTKKSYYSMSNNDRMNTNRKEKTAIAKSCASLINDGDTLMIVSGTTTRYLARELAERSNLTIVTNSVLVAEEFLFNSSINVILLGGSLDLQYQFTFGDDTVTQLQKYRADKMILAIDGISADHGLSTFHHRETDVSRQMMERSNAVVAVADHSKIGREGFSYIAPLTSIDILVTDLYDEKQAELNEFRHAGIIVEIATYSGYLPPSSATHR